MKRVSLVKRAILVTWMHRFAAACLILAVASPVWAETPQPPADLTRLPLAALISESEELGLPTKFLRDLPPDFVTVTFEDLHRWAAEYHPEEHHMVLNRALSFNQAAGTLRPLTKMTPLEVGNLYHELYHAYMDYLETKPPDPNTDGGRLLDAAKELQKCRYAEVKITPVLQKRTSTETRYLSEREAWETQHETWGVFVGWAVWTKLELIASRGKPGLVTEGGLKRLKKADHDGILVGYYEPEDQQERKVAQKRYLAPAYRILPQEIRTIMVLLFGEPADAADRAAAAAQPASPKTVPVPSACKQ
jgi:hypothetical protein